MDKFRITLRRRALEALDVTVEARTAAEAIRQTQAIVEAWKDHPDGVWDALTSHYFRALEEHHPWPFLEEEDITVDPCEAPRHFPGA